MNNKLNTTIYNPSENRTGCKSITNTLAPTCQNPAEDTCSQYFYSHSTREGIPPVKSR